jgi:hypothetical protein
MKRSLRQFRDGLDSDYGNLITLKVELHVCMAHRFIFYFKIIITCT